MNNEKNIAGFRPDINFEFVGQNALVLRDPLNLAGEPLVLNPLLSQVLGEFSKENEFSILQSKLSRFGMDSKQIEELIKILNDYFLLNNDHFRTKRDVLITEFAAQKVRAAAFSGGVYPADKLSLTRQMDDWCGGSGQATKKPLGVMAPHIDYQRGEKGYRQAFCLGSEMPGPSVLLLGPTHQYSRGMFHFTSKDFEIPNGCARADVEAIDILTKDLQHCKPFAEEILHRQEHSLELELPFLMHFGNTRKWIPLLLGSFHKALVQKEEPKSDPGYQEVIERFVEYFRSRPLCFVAGVDMAHVGRAFGDDWDLSEQKRKDIETQDREYLEFISKRDSSGLFEHMAQDTNARRICGFPTMYFLLDLMERLNLKPEVDIRCYEQAFDEQQMVTFASAWFHF